MWSQVFSKAHLWIRFLCRLSLNAPLFLKCFLLCKICVRFCCISLCVHCCVADKSMHRFTSEGTVKPGKLEKHSGLQLQHNTECLGKKFELFLFIYVSDIAGSNAAEKGARFIFIFILTTFLKVMSVLYKLYFPCFLFHGVKNNS